MKVETVTGQSDSHIHWLSNNIGLHKAVVKPWQLMCDEAKNSGFNLTIASGFRSFERQLSIWNRKFSGELVVKSIDNQVVDISNLSEKEIIDAILTFSALPGTSRHHWGTDIDFYDPSLLRSDNQLQLEPWEYEGKGPFAKLTQWLQQNAKHFGFYFPYDVYRGGVAAEPWHLSYFPIATKVENHLNHESLLACIQSSDILGKKQLIKELDHILSQYVFNIGSINHE